MKTAACILLLVLTVARSVQAHFAFSEQMPVNQVLNNATAYLLGRIHYFAFANRSPDVSVYQSNGSDRKLPYAVVYQREPVDWGQRKEAKQKAGIISIAVSAGLKEDHLHPLNPRGLTLRDGSTRSVWDWFASPLAR